MASTLPKIMDNDFGNIRLEVDNASIRSWSYSNDEERRVRMQKAHEFVSGYDEGRRALLNDLLALNPEVEANLAKFHEREPSVDGKLPFDAVFWVTGVANQLDIQPREVTKS